MNKVIYWFSLGFLIHYSTEFLFSLNNMSGTIPDLVMTWFDLFVDFTCMVIFFIALLKASKEKSPETVDQVKA